MARATETGQTEKSHGGGYHESRIYGRYRNLVSRDDEFQPVLDTVPHHTQFYFCVSRAAQPAHDFLTAHLHTGNGCVVHADDAVACQDAHLFRRSFGHGLNDDKRVFQHVELYADTVEITLQRFVHFLGLLGVGIRGVRVQFGEHPVDSVLRQFHFVHTVHVQAADGQLGHGEFTHGLFHFRHVPFPLCRSCPRKAEKQGCPKSFFHDVCAELLFIRIPALPGYKARCPSRSA